MRLLSLGLNLPVACGLAWQVPREAKEVKSTPRKFARKLHGRVLGQDGDIAFGEDRGDGDPPAKAYCGAALVAAAAADAFVYHELPCGDEDEQLVWVCGVGRGLPLPGFDEVLPPHEARVKYNEFVSFNTEAQVYGSLSEARESLAELLARVGDKQRKNTRLVRAGVNLIAVGCALGVPLVGALAVMAFAQFEAAREREQITRKEMLERQLATAAQRKKVEDARAEFQAEVQMRRLAVEAQADPLLTVDTWVGVLSQEVPISFRGWHPLSATCLPTGCSVKWRGASQALPMDILALPGRPESKAPVAPSTVIDIVPSTRSSRQKVGREFDLALLSFGRASGAEAMVALQGEPQTVRVEPPPLLREQGVAPEIVGTVGRFQVTFRNLVALREFAKWVQPYAVSIERLEAVSFAPNVGSPAYQVDGIYVVSDPAN